MASRRTGKHTLNVESKTPNSPRQNGVSAERNFGARFAATSLLLISLFALTIAASSAQFVWQRPAHVQQPTIRLPQTDLSPSDLHQQYGKIVEPAHEFATPDKYQVLNQLAQLESESNHAPRQHQIGGAGQDDEVRQFLVKLLVARKVLDDRLAGERLANELRKQSAGSQVEPAEVELTPNTGYNLVGDDEQEQRHGGSFEAPIDSDELLATAHELAAQWRQQNQQQQQPTNLNGNSDDEVDLSQIRATNPTYYNQYSVPNEEQHNQAISEAADFEGQFGPPVASGQQPQQQPMKRDSQADEEWRRPRAKLTTLLEDEEQQAGRLDEAAKASGAADGTTVSYGRVLNGSEQTPRPGESGDVHGSFFGSLFDQLNKQIGALLTSSWWTSSGNKAKSSGTELDSAKSKQSIVLQAVGEQEKRSTGEDTGAQVGLAQDKSEPAKDRAGAANQDVSLPQSDNDGKAPEEARQPTSGLAVLSEDKPSVNKSEQREEDKKQALDKVIRIRLEKAAGDSSVFGEQSAGFPASKRVHIEAAPDSQYSLDRVWPQQELVNGQQVALDQQPQKPMLGKYVYAPTQHYYLNGLPSALRSAAFEDPQLLESNRLPQHFGAGDRVFGSLPVQPQNQQHQQQQRLEPAYAFQKQDSLAPLMLTTSQLSAQSTSNKPNDLYFLVMVGAFCVMAMAVVLAAGLFAYRVQQTRKSSEVETEYPTYGVVGPNNMGAKCGASAFVGGYLANQTGSFTQMGNRSKSSSARHLSDLYACSLGAGSDSGLASLDQANQKSNNANGAAKKSGGAERTTKDASATIGNQDAARMYHYQHQKQQMIVSDRSSAGRHTSASDLDSEDENDEGSYTVYECPGLASAHEMEIKNPLFNDERTP